MQKFSGPLPEVVTYKMQTKRSLFVIEVQTLFYILGKNTCRPLHNFFSFFLPKIRKLTNFKGNTSKESNGIAL